MNGRSVDLRELPPHADLVDGKLAKFSAQIEWISAVSPINLEDQWQQFKKSKCDFEPIFKYREKPSFRTQRECLKNLPSSDIEHPVLRSLLLEKQLELSRLMELIELRGTSGFLQQSIALFGEAEPPLVASAKQIMELPVYPEAHPLYIGAAEFVEAAEIELDYYRAACEGFESGIDISATVAAGVMVVDGQLVVSASLRIPESRLRSLLHHEIGTHILTHFNGGQQALRQLKSGLAHYDSTQEGLGVLAEFLCGNLPLGRLRTLAARVLAVRAMIEGAGFVDVYRSLARDYGVSDYGAFITTARVFRGGGLTKDAVYLRGLQQILDYLKEGHSPEDLFIGKFSLDQFSALVELRSQGWLLPNCALPRYWNEAGTHERMQQCAEHGLSQLLQEAAA